MIYETSANKEEAQSSGVSIVARKKHELYGEWNSWGACWSNLNVIRHVYDSSFNLSINHGDREV